VSDLKGRLEKLKGGDRTPVDEDEIDVLGEDTSPPTMKKVGLGFWLWIKELLRIEFFVWGFGGFALLVWFLFF
jgi:hypothetical protein